MESSLLYLPFLAREMNISVIEVHQRVQSFRISMDRFRVSSTQLLSYRVVLNPQVRASVELFRDYRRRDSFWRRGAVYPNFRRNFAELMHSHHPTIVVLVETRILGQRVVDVSTALGFDRVIRSDAEGFSGGIWLLWDSGSVTLDILQVNNQAIHAIVHVHHSNPPWLFIALYASPKFATRLSLWEHLTSFAGSHNLPWMIAGDFNEILASNEKFSTSLASQRRISCFHNCLDKCNLLDLGFNGPRFTWTNKRQDGLVMEKLDRVLCNPAWKHSFEEVNVIHLPRIASDHSPILINTEPTLHNFGTRPFRLETIWFNDPSFPNLVHDSWTKFPQNVPLAIHDFTNRVTTWNRQVFGNIFHRKRRLLARLNGIQKALSFRPCLALLELEK
ncbi:hypothetical protein FCV25MIE_09699 [Fagus crenata]